MLDGPDGALAPDLLTEVRARFAHVEDCPYQGERAFFENAGGALTLRSVLETSARHAAVPDNPGRDNPAGRALVDVIERGKDDLRLLLGASGGTVIAGESGTELIFRVIRAACLGAGGGIVLGSTIEHPATRSAAARWSEAAGMEHRLIAHDAERGLVTPEAYAEAMTPEVRVATILHTSPVTGMGMDLTGIGRAIRAVSPDCVVVVDGIQHAAHGPADVEAAGVDAYVISPYKCFSRHGYGLAWLSERAAALPHDHLAGAPGEPWELGTRDAGAYACFSEVVRYLEWLGGEVSEETEARAMLLAAGRAIHDHEARLCHAAMFGTGNRKGLAELPGLHVLGGESEAREGLVSVWSDDVASEEIVARLNEAGIRTHIRKADHYSANALEPLGLKDCVRISFCHYNSEAEIARMLGAMAEIAGG